MTDLFAQVPMTRPMNAQDAETVLAIYGEGIGTGHATFADAVPAFEDWCAAHLSAPRIAADLDGAVAGWAALAGISGRPVYAGVAEVSVYVRAAAKGRGVGDALMKSLIAQSEAVGIWTLQAGIFPENTASLGLHQKNGFRIVGMREKIGKMLYGPLRGQWRDVILLERRSPVAGQD